MNFEVRERKPQEDDESTWKNRSLVCILLFCLVVGASLVAGTLYTSAQRGRKHETMGQSVPPTTPHIESFTANDLKFFTGCALLQAFKDNDKARIQELIKNTPFLHVVHQARVLESVFLKCQAESKHSSKKCTSKALQCVTEAEAVKIAAFLKQRSAKFHPEFVKSFRQEASKSNSSLFSWSIVKHTNGENVFAMLPSQGLSGSCVSFDLWSEGEDEILTRQFFDDFPDQSNYKFLRIQKDELFVTGFPRILDENSFLVEAKSKTENYKLTIPLKDRNAFFANSSASLFTAKGTMKKNAVFSFEGDFAGWIPTVGTYLLKAKNSKLYCHCANENIEQFKETLFRVGTLKAAGGGLDWTYGNINLATSEAEGFFVQWKEALKSVAFKCSYLQIPSFSLNSKMEFLWQGNCIPLRIANFDWKNKSFLYKIAHVLFIPRPQGGITVAKAGAGSQITQLTENGYSSLFMILDLQVPAFSLSPEGELQEIRGQEAMEVELKSNAQVFGAYSDDAEVYQKIWNSILEKLNEH